MTFQLLSFFLTNFFELIFNAIHEV